MMDAYNKLHNLVGSLLSKGFVKLKRYGDILIIYAPIRNSNKKSKMSQVTIDLPINFKNVCWVTPYRSSKNMKLLNIIDKIIEKSNNDIYLTVVPIGNGSGFKVSVFDAIGKCIKSVSIKLFSINLGKVKSDKPTNKNNMDKYNNNRSNDNLLAINGNHSI